MPADRPVPRYPVGLNLADKLVVLIGGGAVAERRVGKLLTSGARIRLVSPTATPELERLAAARTVDWERRHAETDDVQGATLVVLATSDAPLHDALAAAARAEGALVNRADAADQGDVVVPMSFVCGGLTVAIHGDGVSPAFTRWVAQLLEKAIGPETEAYANLLREARLAVLQHTHLPQEQRAALLRSLTEEGELFKFFRTHGHDATLAEVQRRIEAWKG